MIRTLFTSWINKENPPVVSTSNELIAGNYQDLKTRYCIDAYLSQLATIVGLPEKHFTLLYETPIRLLCCRLQHIPDATCETNLAITVKLEQIIAGMKYRESYIMPEGVSPEEINLKKDVWRYAAFYASLLVNIGPILTSRSITFKSPLTKAESTWNPFGNLIPEKSMIRYKPTTPLDHTSSLIFSPLLFSPASIEWLYKEKNALQQAIEAITGKPSTHALSTIIRATIKNKQPVENQQKPHNDIASDPDIITTKDGALFFDWLKGEIKHKGVENTQQKAFYFIVRDLLYLVVPRIFEQYSDLYQKDAKTVESHFIALDYHLKNEDSHYFEYTVKNDITLKTIKLPYVIFTNL